MPHANPDSFWSHFYWLAFVGFSLVLSEAARRAIFFHSIRAPWLDVMANYALLGGLAVAAAVLGAAGLRIAEALSRGLKYRALEHAPHAVVFAVFVVAWLNIWYTGLSGALPPGFRVPAMVRVTGGLCVALMGLIVFRGRIRDWLLASSRHLRASVLVLTPACFLLSVYFVLQPLRLGHPAPVIFASTDRGSPNVIIVVLDTLRARDVSAYGYLLPTTPNLDELTRTWTVYENAHSTGNGTPAVLPTLLTGRYYYLDEGYRYGDLTRAANGWMSLPAVLKKAQYQNVYFGAVGSLFMPGRYHLNTAFDRILGGKPFPGRELLLDRSVWLGIVGQMEVDYRAYTGLPAASDTSTSSVPDVRDERPESMYGVAERYLIEQSTHSPARSFFAVFHMFRPHFPFVADELMGTFLPLDAGLTSINSQTKVLGQHVPPVPQSLVDNLRLRYDENILKADAQVGHLVRTLKQLGLYDQSLIVVVADHGFTINREYVGAYSRSLTSAEHRIPLLVKYPWQKEGRRVKQVVSSVDIMPTVLDVIGASYPAGWVDGRSLRKTGQQDDRIVFVRQVGQGSVLENPTVAAISGDLKLVNRQGRLSLFNMHDDPDEQHDLLPLVDADALKGALSQFVMRKAAIDDDRSIDETPPLIDRISAATLYIRDRD